MLSEIQLNEENVIKYRVKHGTKQEKKKTINYKTANETRGQRNVLLYLKSKTLGN